MISLSALKYLIDTAKLQSLSKASKINYVSSSAISQAIKAIESHYEIQIFVHGKNKFEMTEHGEQFVERAKIFLESYQKFNKDISLMLGNSIQDFHFSTQQSIANIILSKTISTFSENYPSKKLRVSVGTTSRCQEWLERGQIKYSLSLDNVKFNAHKTLVKEGKFVLISSKNETRAIEEVGIITTEDTDEVIELRRSYFQKFGKPAPIINQVSSWGVISKMAIAGLGMAYIPDYILKSLDKSDYKIKKLDIPIYKYNLNFYSPKNRPLDEYQKKLIAHIKKIL